MTAVAALVADLQARGVSLVPDGDRLRVRPTRLVTPEELDALRRCKVEVLALVAGDRIKRYQGTLAALWTLNTQPQGEADREKIHRLLDTQARECDELGVEVAAAVSRRAARAWARERQRCPWCGLPGVFHDPVTGEERALEGRRE